MTMRYAFAALAMIGGAALATPAAQAMPNGLPASAVQTSGVENVRWVCGPYRCWWEPRRHRFHGSYGFYAPRGYYAPRLHYRPHHRHGWDRHRSW